MLGDEAGVTDRLVASPPRDTAMLPLPTRFAGLILAFAPLFVHRSWRHAQILLVGAILTPGRRTVTSVLRIMGRAQERRNVLEAPRIRSAGAVGARLEDRPPDVRQVRQRHDPHPEG